MTQTMPSFRWFRAFRMIILSVGILLAVFTLAVAAWGGLFQIAAGDEMTSSSFAAAFYASRTFYYQMLVLFLLTDALFFGTFAVLRRGSRLSVYFSWGMNVWLPLTFLLINPILSRYFTALLNTLQDVSDITYGVGIAGFRQLLAYSTPLICILLAVFFVLLLLPNSIYFYKRRDYIHPGVVY